MRMVKTVVLPIVIGIFLIIGGISQLGDSSVKCGGKTQTADQVCVTKGERRTLDEQRAENRSSGWVLLGLGAFMLIGGGIGAVAGIGGRSRVAAGQQFAGSPQFRLPQHQPGPYLPNQPYTPQQYSQSFGRENSQQWR